MHYFEGREVHTIASEAQALVLIMTAVSFGPWARVVQPGQGHQFYNLCIRRKLT